MLHAHKSPSGKSPQGKRAYEVVAPLGRGAFGIVSHVRHKESGSSYVMKEVQLSGLSKSQLLRARDEVRVLQQLHHPHIIAYRESFLEDLFATLYIVMEFADAGDLQSLVRSRAKAGQRFSEREVLRLLAQCLAGLEYCHHEVHLLHRDIKPANVFLTRHRGGDGGGGSGGDVFDVKLGDFGISTSVATSQAVANTKCGSPLYMSPELCAGKPYDRGADLWALGCTFYEVCSLQEPWLDQYKGGKGMMLMGLYRLIKSVSTLVVVVVAAAAAI